MIDYASGAMVAGQQSSRQAPPAGGQGAGPGPD
jgi:hypothetical protein